MLNALLSILVGLGMLALLALAVGCIVFTLVWLFEKLSETWVETIFWIAATAVVLGFLGWAAYDAGSSILN